MDIKKVFGEKFLLKGVKLKVGMIAPDCDLFDQAFSKASLFENGHKPRLIGVFPSAGIEKCSREIHRLDVEGYIMGDKVEVVAVTGDNPVNLCRFSFDKDIEQVRLLADYWDHSFARQYGFMIDELRLPAKGLIVVDGDNIIRYIQYAEGILEDLNFLEAVRVVKESY